MQVSKVSLYLPVSLTAVAYVIVMQSAPSEFLPWLSWVTLASLINDTCRLLFILGFVLLVGLIA